MNPSAVWNISGHGHLSGCFFSFFLSQKFLITQYGVYRERWRHRYVLTVWHGSSSCSQPFPLQSYTLCYFPITQILKNVLAITSFHGNNMLANQPARLAFSDFSFDNSISPFPPPIKRDGRRFDYSVVCHAIFLCSCTSTSQELKCGASVNEKPTQCTLCELVKTKHATSYFKTNT